MGTFYQLRRLKFGCDSRTPSSANFDEETVLLKGITRIGRNPDAVDVVLNSTVHGNMISRLHSIIELKQDKGQQKYVLIDKSLNGTYINDFRAKGATDLKVGDIIKFGHVNGAAIKPGCHGPQHSAEFTFIAFAAAVVVTAIATPTPPRRVICVCGLRQLVKLVSPQVYLTVNILIGCSRWD
ncbi:unnamed protein product [Enterobius vermicularis]|uniref:FHA domain-containing protein n=1 Tax=Enterobius vermicularis TaxID=51028 RepID=A0A0N4VM87_ENTVE|nr:unnamed protein product [Enterobius vermicularis]